MATTLAWEKRQADGKHAKFSVILLVLSNAAALTPFSNAARTTSRPMRPDAR